MPRKQNSPMIPLVLFGILLMLQYGSDTYKRFVKEQEQKTPGSAAPNNKNSSPPAKAKPSGSGSALSEKEFYTLPSQHQFAMKGLARDFKAESETRSGNIQAYLNQLDRRHRTPLVVAILSKNYDFARMLLDLGADVHIPDDAGNSPMLIALVHGTDDLASDMILKGGNFLTPNKDGLTPLHAAAQHGRVRMAVFLIEHGAPINAVFANGWTPLHYAAQNGFPEIVTLLLEKGADLSVRLDFGWSPLDLAKAQKRQACVEAFNRFAERPVRSPTHVPAEMKFLPPGIEEKGQ